MINPLLPESPKLAHKKCATWSWSRPAWPAEHMVISLWGFPTPSNIFSHLQRKVKKQKNKCDSLCIRNFWKLKKKGKTMAKVHGCYSIPVRLSRDFLIWWKVKNLTLILVLLWDKSCDSFYIISVMDLHVLDCQLHMPHTYWLLHVFLSLKHNFVSCPFPAPLGSVVAKIDCGPQWTAGGLPDKHRHTQGHFRCTDG